MSGLRTAFWAALSLLSLSCGAPDILDTRTGARDLRAGGDEGVPYGAYPSYEHFIRAGILGARDDLEGAADEMKAALVSDPDDFLLRTEYARILIRLGKIHSARRHLSRAILMEPTAQTAWVALADLYMEEGNRDKAVEAARHGMRVEPQEPEAARWMAKHYREEGDMESAAHLCREILSLDPGDLEALLCVGEAAFATGDRREAREHYVRYLSSGGTETALVMDRIRGEMSGEGLEWIRLLSDLVEVRPGDAALREELVVILLDHNMSSSAVLHIRTLPSLAPGDEEEARRRAGWLQRAGRPYEARSVMIDSMGCDGAEPDSRVMLASLEIELLRPEVALDLLDVEVSGWSEELAVKAAALRDRAKLEIEKERKGGGS